MQNMTKLVQDAEEKVLKCFICINQLDHLLKISWRYTCSPGCPTYLPVVLNLKLCTVSIQAL